MFSVFRRSIRHKFLVVILATTLAALLFTAVALVIYDLQTYRSTWVRELSAQAEIIGLASSPALTFDDPPAARENLAFLQVRPEITAAGIYTVDGRLFASYRRDAGGAAPLPILPGPDGHQIEGNQLTLVQPIRYADERLGTVVLEARYALRERLASYLAIVVGVMIASLLVAALMSLWLQAGVTQPIIEITGVARQVKERRDFSLRARRTTEDETGFLVETFNDMLAEVEQRTRDLETANRKLEREVMVRHEAERALLAADQSKDEFLATLAHELRNPLAPLRNAVEILRASQDPKTSETAREIMDRQLRQLVRLVDDLLDVSRITTGKVTLRRELVPLQQIVQSALETVAPLIETRRLELSVTLPEGTVTVHADPTRLAQVFSNLLNNAAKFTEPGGGVSLLARTQDGTLEVTVADTGIGIPADMLPTIFEMFTQLDRSLERPHGGLGVGLALSQRLVELHGGVLEATSDGLHRGSRFVVRLPGVVRTISPEASRDPAPDGHPVPGRRRVVVADDNGDFRESFAMMLRDMGHEVTLVHDGVEAFRAIATLSPDVAFLDIGLPGLNGYELARRLRRISPMRRTVLVAVTGWGQAADRRLAKDAGFDHHLVKPVEPAQIEPILVLSGAGAPEVPA